MESSRPIVQADLPPLTLSGRSVIATTWVSFFLAFLWTLLRIWARRLRRLTPFLLEDIFCYIALLAHFAYTVNSIYMAIHGGIGYHIEQLQPFQVEIFSKTTFIAQILYAVGLGFIKLSIARTFQRIYFTHKFKIAAYIGMGAVVAWVLQTVFIGSLICQPVELNWNPDVRGHCGNEKAAFTSVSAVDILTDIYLLLLPMRPLYYLQISRIQKIYLGLIFSGAFLTVVVTAIRLYLVFAIDYDDLSYSVPTSLYLTIIQPGVGMMVACSPHLKPILDLFSTTTNSRKTKSSNNSKESGSDALSSISRPTRTGRSSKRLLQWSTNSGFDRIADNNEPAVIELGAMGEHEAHATAHDVNHSDKDEVLAAGDGGITVMRETIVSSSL
ncbi:GPCR, PTH11-type [Xylaria cf. heliscus]|nr:GPCR, PTH11-type [Xylaria cf. heliscus]